MRTTILIALMCLVALSGCKRGPRPPTTPKPEDPVVAAVKAVNRAQKRTVNALELRELHLTISDHYLNSGMMMPSKEWIMDTMKKENRKLYDMLQDGTIVLTELKVYEGIWAYEKDALTDANGGFILTHVGPERLTSPEEVKKRLGMK